MVSFASKTKPKATEGQFHVFKSKDGKIIKKFPDRLDEYYGQRNIIVIGSAATTPQISSKLKEIEKMTEELTSRGYNIITGAGKDGVMGAAINGSFNAMERSHYEYIGNSLSIITQNGWGDEDLYRSKPISMAISGKESERIEIFNKLLSNPFSAVIVAKPGCTTLQEMTTFIAMNKYRKKGTPPNRIFLLGKETFEPIKKQYKKMYEDGTYPVNPYDKNNQDQLFEVIEPNKILQKFPDMQETLNEEIRKYAKIYLGLPEQVSQSELAKAYDDFIKKAHSNQKLGLYLYVKKDPQTQKDRTIEGKELLQMVNSADGELYHLAINSGLYQIQQACLGKTMSWQKRK